VEHSGLGRYGDALNPWGDIIAIARSWCVTEEGGSLTIGVMYDKELDYIKFNAGRWYGKIRYPYLTTNWKQHYRGNGIQRVHVFTKEKLDYTKPLQYYLKKPYPYHPVSNVDIKYSQARQDEVVYNIFPKKNGFFIDIGANDGELFSNSLWLERKHNWTGLLIEANPDLCRKIDILGRQAWRLCACISDTLNKTKFIQSGTVGGMQSEIDDHHMKQIKTRRTITVPCFNMNAALDEINVHHIDFFSLDVEGAELIVLNSMKNELSSRKMTVDVWSIEFRVYDGTRNIEQKSLENLEKLRTFFKEIGGYTEHSQVDNIKNNENNAALDVIFVNVKTWCKTQKKLPNGTECSEVIHI
jgi:FkbM family methyltransferase